jgi:hypothetical protein
MQKLRMIAGSVRPARGACAELTNDLPDGDVNGRLPG